MRFINPKDGLYHGESFIPFFLRRAFIALGLCCLNVVVTKPQISILGK